jgi:molybdopterin-synthase adenylyltransferase
MTQRFSRQIKIKWWDQTKISNTNAMIVGCGGLGCYAALQLTLLGVRKLTLVDMDAVDQSNLNRQLFYEKDVGRLKVEALKDKLMQINSKLKIETYSSPIQKVNDDVYKNINFVFDCLDNIETREYLSELCWNKKIPFIHSACSDVIGEVQLVVNGKTKKMKEYPKDMKLEQKKKSCKDFDPAVCTTNMVVASLQVDKFLDYLIKGDVAKPFTHYMRGMGITYGG